MLVTDASAWLGLVMPDEDHRFAASVALEVRAGGAAVPSIFWWEVRHVLVAGERKRRQTRSASDGFLLQLAELGVKPHPASPERQTMDLARKHRLSVYDAGYLELAQRTGSVLASLDKRLNAAAEREGVQLFVVPA